MSYKENSIMGSSMSSVSIKPEPREEAAIAPLTRSDCFNHESDADQSGQPKVKTELTDAARVFLDRGLPVPAYVLSKTDNSYEPSLSAASVRQDVISTKEEDVPMEDMTSGIVSKPSLFKVYSSADEIQYTPEEALEQGLGMVSSIKSCLKHLQLGSKLREEVWMRELESLTSQGAPTTLIAVCGATGAGKSSILNAILDDNIVPTSGMRACTAVVTELAYHNKRTIEADVSFLSESEWMDELAVLLSDLIDEGGNLKRSTDLKSDAGIAWQKVHAVYPKISQGQLVHMAANEIIAHDQNIAKILGVTKTIVTNNSKAFAQEIAKYIDSKDQNRGEKEKDKGEKKDKGKKKEKGKKKDKGKKKEKNLMDKHRQTSGTLRSSNNKVDADAPALWPLIRQVNVRCNSAALSTGAVLVDLPGVADANAARNKIAKDYMKKCDCIWILAPITRAVDDKTARDLLGDAFKMQLMNGNYDDHAITFIASKCDDVSCSEVIRALQLEDDPDLEAIEERLEQLDDENMEWKASKSSAEKNAKAIHKELEELHEYADEYKAHLKALQDGEYFTPRLTAKNKSKSKSLTSKKRKNARSGKKGSPKRRRSSVSDNDESIIDSDSDSESAYDSNNDSDDSSYEKDSDSDSDIYSSDSDSDGGDEDIEEVTEEHLKRKIKETKESIKQARKRLSLVRKQKKIASHALATVKKNITKAQRDKNAFCSLKRSEFSRDVLKEDFRVGLKDLDDTASEERDPVNFDPTQKIRNYDVIDLPVFTCSSRDYVRLKGQVKGDGEPTCFSNAKDTGVPDLQQWCHELTLSSRERIARNFLAHLKTFATSVQSYVQGIGDVTASDRESLREKWESSGNLDGGHDEEGSDAGYRGWDDDPFAAILGGLGGDLGTGLYSMHKPKPMPKVDTYGQPLGIAPRLASEFGKLIDNCVHDLQDKFKDGLEDKCKLGATHAATAAVPTSDEFAASMHWATYRATLRRHGSWRRDLNVELITPFTRNIAHSWSKVFESDLFGPFEAASTNSINRLLKDVEDSAAKGLKDRTRMQGEQCHEEAHVALQKTMDIVRETLNNEQKEVSRCMAPHVQAQLVEGYDRATEESGTGSVARQKAYFHEFINDCKAKIFDDGADVLMERLTNAAEAVGSALREALGQLAEKIEVNLSILWEGTREDPAQVKARNNIVVIIEAVLEHVQMWSQAERERRLVGDGNTMQP